MTFDADGLRNTAVERNSLAVSECDPVLENHAPTRICPPPGWVRLLGGVCSVGHGSEPKKQQITRTFILHDEPPNPQSAFADQVDI